MNPIDRWQRLSSQSTPYNQSPVGVVKSPRCHFEWKINHFYSLTNECIFSEYFQFDDIHWRMQMSWANPNERTKNISVSMQKKYSSAANRPNVGATIGFKRSDGSIFDAIRKVLKIQAERYVVFPPESYAILYSIPFSEWKDIELPDSLTVVCILDFSDAAVSDTTCLPVSDSILVKDFEDLFLSERDADVTMRVKGRQFKAHRSILVARSTVLATMFQHDMTERRKGEVDIDDCDPDSFRDFLVYLYTGKTDQVTADNARDLYITADKYLVEELKAKCSQRMSLSLSIDSTCDVLVLATMHNDTKLLKTASDFFVKNVKQILESPKWLEFQSKNFKLVHELFLKTSDHVKL